MSTPLENEVTKSASPTPSVKECDCPTTCPKCGADLTGTPSNASSTTVSETANSPVMANVASVPAAPVKKGLFGLGFLGLGGRRRKTAHRRRRTTHRRRRNTRRNHRRAHKN